jgi:hypothetical protein
MLHLSGPQDQDRPETALQVPYPELARYVGPRYTFSTFDEVRTRDRRPAAFGNVRRPFSGPTRVVFGPNRRPAVFCVPT